MELEANSSDRAVRPETAAPAYEPPTLLVIGTVAELTLANQAGGSPDFSFNASP